jgi:hypothetical protein
MRADLLSRIELHRGGDRSRAEATADHFGHPEDSPAQVATEKDLELAIGDHEMVELNAINAALTRIDREPTANARTVAWTFRRHAWTLPRKRPGASIARKRSKNTDQPESNRFFYPSEGSLFMSTFHAVVWMDHSEAHVVMFDREHMEAQRIKSRSHHKHQGKTEDLSRFLPNRQAAGRHP